MIKTIGAEAMETCRGIGESGREEKAHEITQFGNMLTWFGLCLAAALPLWLMSSLGSEFLLLFLPLQVLEAAAQLSSGSDWAREVYFVCGLGYFAGILSPILIWRPSTPRKLMKIVVTVAALHPIIVLLSMCRAAFLGILWAIFFGFLSW